MATILNFPSHSDQIASSRKKPADQKPAEAGKNVIIFPGVRVERAKNAGSMASGKYKN